MVLDAGGSVLAVFTDVALAEQCADDRQGHVVRPVPMIWDQRGLRTVHTRWIEVDADGVLRRDDRDNYVWCQQLQAAGDTPPLAEVEHCQDGARQRLLCLGTDAAQLDRHVEERLAALA